MTTTTRTTRSQDDNVLSLYLKDINKIPLLTREEENALAHLAAQGDKKAKDKIVTSNLRFVVNVAKKYQNQGLPLVDLISEGNIGLLTAIERFDVLKGYHFISYAVWWIRQSILKAICEKSRMIRLPLNRANELVQIEKARKAVQSDKSEEEEIAEIADMLGMSASHVREILNIARDMVSLDSPLGVENSTNSLGDFIEDSQYDFPEEIAISNSMKADINMILRTLTEKEADVIRYRFGLDGVKSMSLKEVGDILNLTKERIRQIEKKAIRRLQHPARMERLDAYVA